MKGRFNLRKIDKDGYFWIEDTNCDNLQKWTKEKWEKLEMRYCAFGPPTEFEKEIAKEKREYYGINRTFFSKSLTELLEKSFLSGGMNKINR